MIFLYVLAAIVLLLILAVLLAPTQFRFSTGITIQKSKDDVFAYLKLLKNQDNWSVWGRMDPDMKKEYRGTDGTVGFVSAWEGNKKVGKGEQEIMQIEDGKRIEFQLRFELPFKVTNGAELIVEDAGNGKTKVTWGFFGRSPRPMNLFSLFMKGMIIKDFNTGLANLKAILEK